MKKYIIMGTLALAATSLIADEGVSKKTTTSHIEKKSTISGSADRTLELRVGPRVSFLSGPVRIGVTGTEFDIWDDLQIDDPNIGVQFDADYQPINRWHLNFGFTYDNIDQSGTTKKDIGKIAGDNERLLSGATITAKEDIYTFEGKIGFDAVKNNTYRLQPYIGGKGIVIDGTFAINGTATGSFGGSTHAITSTSNRSDAYGTFFGGVDQRLYISRQWYLGADVGGFALDRWGYITGDGYTGYDFTKNLGVRTGYSFDWGTYENSNKSVFAEPLLGAAYVQLVWGF